MIKNEKKLDFFLPFIYYNSVNQQLNYFEVRILISFVEFDDLSDEELISRIRSGEDKLFSVLAHRYLPFIRFLATRYSVYSMEIDDLIQEGTIALFGAIRDYRTGESAFSSFAFLCIRRALADACKSVGRKRRIPVSMIAPLEDCGEFSDSENPEKILIEREEYRNLTDSIRLELSEMEYQVLADFLAGNSYATISEKQGISVKSVDNALRRIRTKLKDKKSV